MIILSIHPTHKLRASDKFYFPTPKLEQTSRTIENSKKINRKNVEETEIMQKEVSKVIFNQFISVAQSCLTLRDPMNRSRPGLPVYHQLPESTQTHVHWVSDAIQPLHPLSFPSPPVLNLSQHQGLYPQSSQRGWCNLEIRAGDPIQISGKENPWDGGKWESEITAVLQVWRATYAD